jgi:hypothetical protein
MIQKDEQGRHRPEAGAELPWPGGALNGRDLGLMAIV